MWHKITVEQYQQIVSVQKESIDDVDKVLQIIGIVYNLTEDQVNNLPIPTYHKYVSRVTEMFTQPAKEGKALKSIKASGRTYKIQYKASKLRYGQWTEIQHFLKGGIIENLHLLAASVAQPVKFGITFRNDSNKHEQRASHFLQANFIQTYSSVVFFCNALINSKKDTPDYLEMMNSPRASRIMETATRLMNGTDGYIQPQR